MPGMLPARACSRSAASDRAWVRTSCTFSMTSVQSFGSTRSRQCFWFMISSSGGESKGIYHLCENWKWNLWSNEENAPNPAQSLSDLETIGYDTSCSFYHGFISLAHSEPFGEMNP